MVMSETGANDDATDDNKYGTYANRYISAFDREMRANIGYVDHIMYHAAFSPGNFTMWVADTDLDKLNPKMPKRGPTAATPTQPRLKDLPPPGAGLRHARRAAAYLFVNKTTWPAKKRTSGPSTPLPSAGPSPAPIRQGAGELRQLRHPQPDHAGESSHAGRRPYTANATATGTCTAGPVAGRSHRRYAEAHRDAGPGRVGAVHPQPEGNAGPDRPATLAALRGPSGG
jgi:hypothetical protein